MTQTIVKLDDKYDVEAKSFYLTGTQALVRLPLLQRQLDLRAGLNTGGFVSGYRGSPLGSVDLQMVQARKSLEAANIQLRPGLNEELAATADPPLICDCARLMKELNAVTRSCGVDALNIWPRLSSAACHRSYLRCMSSQTPGSVANASDSLSAISGEIAARPFRMR